MDLHNHAHPLGVFIKSHEDTLSCLDTLIALQVVFQSAHGQPLRLCLFVSDRAWAFLNSNLEALAAEDVQVGLDSHGSCYAHFMRALEKADCRMPLFFFHLDGLDLPLNVVCLLQT